MRDYYLDANVPSLMVSLAWLDPVFAQSHYRSQYKRPTQWLVSSVPPYLRSRLAYTNDNSTEVTRQLSSIIFHQHNAYAHVQIYFMYAQDAVCSGRMN